MWNIARKDKTQKNMMSIRKWSYKKVVLLIVLGLAIVAAGFGVDAFCQRHIWQLSEEDRGINPVEVSRIDAMGMGHDENGLTLYGQEGVMDLKLWGQYVDRLSIEYECSSLLDLTWTVWYEDQDIPVVIEDKNSIFVHTTTERLNGNIERIDWYCKQDTEEPYTLSIKGIHIINEYELNWYRVIFVWVVLALAAFVILGWKWIPGHLAQAYFIAALTLGCLMIFLTPANKASWDEEMHFFHAYCVSHFGGEVETNELLERLFVASDENWPLNLPADPTERQQMNEGLNTWMVEEEFLFSRGHALAGIYTPAYIPAAIGLRIGFLFDLPFTLVYQLGRLGNLIFCVTLMAWAIGKIPVGKAILAMIGLMPTPLFLMAMYSYDAFITCTYALGFAWFLEEYLHKDRKISWHSFGIIALCFSMGALPKAIYIPLILILFLLPKEKFADRRQELWMKGITVILFIALMATFVLPVVISPAETNDLRGGDTSEARQIPYILSNIPRFINMMVYSISHTFPSFTVGASVYGSLGHLGIEMAGTAIPVFVLAVLFADDKCLTLKNTESRAMENSSAKNSSAKNSTTEVVNVAKLKWPVGLWILFFCLMVMGMVWVAMYLAFTPVGSNYVNGVQARYYIPLLLPMYLCLCPDRIRVRVGQNLLYPVAVSGAVVITVVVVAKGMLGLCV